MAFRYPAITCLSRLNLISFVVRPANKVRCYLGLMLLRASRTIPGCAGDVGYCRGPCGAVIKFSSHAYYAHVPSFELSL